MAQVTPPFFSQHAVRATVERNGLQDRNSLFIGVRCVDGPIRIEIPLPPLHAHPYGNDIVVPLSRCDVLQEIIKSCTTQLAVLQMEKT